MDMDRLRYLDSTDIADLRGLKKYNLNKTGGTLCRLFYLILL